MELGTAPIVGSASSSSEEVVLPKTQKPRPAASSSSLQVVPQPEDEANDASYGLNAADLAISRS